MNSQIVAIGNPEAIKNIVENKMFVEEGETFVIELGIYDQQNIINKLESCGVQVCPMPMIDKLFQTELKYVPLKEYNKDTVYDWLKTGEEYFGIIHSNEFNMFSLENTSPELVSKVNMIDNMYFSRSGAILAFVRKGIASFHVNESLDKLMDIRMDETILDLDFHVSDEYVCLTTQNSVFVYELKKAEKIHQFKKGNFCFTSDGFYINNERYILGDGSKCVGKERCEAVKEDNGVGIEKIGNAKDGKKFNELSFIRVDGERMVKYIHGNIPKIIYRDGDKLQSKTTNQIDKDKVFFSNSNMYVIASKKIQKKTLYDVESYSGTKITVNNLENGILSISVSDNYFVIFDTAHNLIFYFKNRDFYTPIKKIKKEGMGLVSTMNGMTCFYNAYQSNLEFYDLVLVNKKLEVRLKYVYSHPGCTNLKWSHSGLYIAAYSTGALNGLIQIFNANAKLIYRKTFGGLSLFKWREFKKMTDDEKAAIGKIPPGMYINEKTNKEDKDIYTLLSEWKTYLTSKINDN